MAITFPPPTKFAMQREDYVNGLRFTGEVIDASGLANRQLLVDMGYMIAVPDGVPYIETDDGRLFLNQEYADAAADRLEAMKKDQLVAEVEQAGSDTEVIDSEGEEEDETIDEWAERVGKLTKQEIIDEVKSLGIEVDESETKAEIVTSAQIVLMERAEQAESDDEADGEKPA